MTTDQQFKSDSISQQLELASLDTFTFKAFLSDTFASHTWEELEEKLCVGSPTTTPPLSLEMSEFPRPWVFVRVLSATLIGYFALLMLLMLYGRNAINVLPAFIFFGCFAIPFAVLTFFFEMNSPKNVSIFQIAKLVMVGGAISFLVTFFLFDYFPLQKIYGAASAGIIEEIAKIIIVIILARIKITQHHCHTLNGVLYGAAVGTGFAAFESAGYALNVGLETNSFAALNHIIVFRGVLSPFTHIVWTAIAGGAFWMSFRENSDKKIISAILNTRFLSLFVISIALHFSWNTDLVQIFNLPSSFYIIQMIILGIISWLVVLRILATGLSDFRNDYLANKVC